MGFTEILTIVFVLLKVFGVISWSWWLVFLPEIIAVGLYVVFFILGVLGARKTRKQIKKHLIILILRRCKRGYKKDF